MTAPRSPALDCLPRAAYGPYDAQPPCSERAVGARRGDAEGVLSALRTDHRDLHPSRNSQKGRTPA